MAKRRNDSHERLQSFAHRLNTGISGDDRKTTGIGRGLAITLGVFSGIAIGGYCRRHNIDLVLTIICATWVVTLATILVDIAIKRL